MGYGAVVGLAVALIFSLTTFRYDLRKDTLDVSFLGVRMRSIPYEEITGITKGWKMVRVNQYLSGKFSILWNDDVALTVTLKSGVVRNVVLSPDDPEGFMDRLREKIGQSPKSDDK